MSVKKQNIQYTTPQQNKKNEKKKHHADCWQIPTYQRQDNQSTITRQEVGVFWISVSL
jgi:hypothetical protein